MSRPKELNGLVNTTELARDLNMLKTTIEHYIRFELLKPDAIRIRGWGDVITDKEFIDDTEKLQSLRNEDKRYEMFFDPKTASKKVRKIKELQKLKRLTLKEIQEYFSKK